MLYYGDEIGMTDVDVPVALRRDHATLDVDGGADRDRARTPMPWDGSPGGGFTSPGVTPWLPMADHPVRTVAGQRDDPDSTLSLCRRLLALRRAELGGGLADFENLPAPEGRLGVPDRSPWWSPRTSPTSRRTCPTEAGEVLLTTSADDSAAVAWRPASLGRRHHAPRAMKDQPAVVWSTAACWRTRARTGGSRG